MFTFTMLSCQGKKLGCNADPDSCRHWNRTNRSWAAWCFERLLCDVATGYEGRKSFSCGQKKCAESERRATSKTLVLVAS